MYWAKETHMPKYLTEAEQEKVTLELQAWTVKKLNETLPRMESGGLITCAALIRKELLIREQNKEI